MEEMALWSQKYNAIMADCKNNKSALGVGLLTNRPKKAQRATGMSKKEKGASRFSINHAPQIMISC